MAKLPFMKFFPKDWLADERLRLCGLAAHGLWINLLCLMHSSPRRGYLQTATGSPIPLEQLARLTGSSTDEVTRLMQELIDAGVCDRTEHGLIYSRRMVKEGDISRIRSEVGKLGGNPRLVKQTANQTATNGTTKPQPTLNPSEVQKFRDKDTPLPPAERGESGSVEVEPKAADPPAKVKPPRASKTDPPIPAELDTAEFRDAWALWSKHRAELRKPLTATTVAKQFAKLAKLGPAEAVRWIDHAVTVGWHGLYPPGDAGKPSPPKAPPKATTYSDPKAAGLL